MFFAIFCSISLFPFFNQKSLPGAQLMTVMVRLFARARDLAGTDAVALDIPAGGGVVDLKRALAERFPQLAPLAPNLLVAVANEYARDDLVITAGAEVACFPPVSGG